jgi:hypothetical protein
MKWREDSIMTDDRVAVIMRRINALAHLASEDVGLMQATADQLVSEGWSGDDVFSFLRNMEEVSPGIPEAVALRRMEKLREKYRSKMRG